MQDDTTAKTTGEQDGEITEDMKASLNRCRTLGMDIKKVMGDFMLAHKDDIKPEELLTSLVAVIHDTIEFFKEADPKTAKALATGLMKSTLLITMPYALESLKEDLFGDDGEPEADKFPKNMTVN